MENNLFYYNKNRDINADVVKGVAILLVVLGHCIQYVYTPNSFDENFIFRVIYSFHMPLFMFISGYLVCLAKKQIDFQWLRKRVISLLLPFVLWSLVGFVIHGKYNSTSVIKYVGYIFISPENGLWFLWVLLLNCVCLYIGNLFTKKIGNWSYLGINILLLVVPTLNFGIGLLKIHFTFYILGFLIRKYWAKVKIYQKIIKNICIVAFPILVIFWDRNLNPSFISKLINITNSMGLPVLCEKLLIVFAFIYRKYLVALCGIGFFFNVFYYFNYWKLKHIKLILAYLGTKTIEIYSMQWYFWNIIKTRSYLANTLIGFFMAVFCPLVFSYIFEQNYVLSFIMFGKKVNTNKIIMTRNIRQRQN